MPDFGNRRVLVVEDDDDTRNLFQNFLEYEGCEVNAQKHPSGVTDVAQYALLLMDIHFGSGAPVGLDWVGEQRRQGNLPTTTKVIFTTGYAADDVKNAITDAVLPKPIELTALRKLLPMQEVL